MRFDGGRLNNALRGASDDASTTTTKTAMAENTDATFASGRRRSTIVDVIAYGRIADPILVADDCRFVLSKYRLKRDFFWFASIVSTIHFRRHQVCAGVCAYAFSALECFGRKAAAGSVFFRKCTSWIFFWAHIFCARLCNYWSLSSEVAVR